MLKEILKSPVQATFTESKDLALGAWQSRITLADGDETEMSEFAEQRPYFSKGPIALVVGCGDMGMACARMLGRRRALMIADSLPVSEESGH